MATVVTFNSPSKVLAYLNSITLPTVWDVIDKGGRYTVLWDNAGTFEAQTANGEDELEAILTPLGANLVRVVPKKAGGHFTFVSVDDVVGGANAFLMKVTTSDQELEDALNAATVIVKVIEHDLKKILIYT